MAILTIAREFGSGGREIGEAVARLLSYEYVDKERLLADIRRAGPKWEEWGKELDEHRPSIWEKYDWSFKGFGALLQSIMLEHALRDNAVLMGRGGNFLLEDIPYALRVRITAPFIKRLERIMERDSVDRETAHWLIQKVDNERASLVHSLYGKKWDDPGAYDLLFDTGLKSIDEVIAIIKDALMEKDKLKTPQSENLLRMRALAARVKAAIATDPSFFLPVFDVVAEGDALVLKGVVHKPKERKRLEDKAQKLAGPVPVRFQLHYRE
jgi:cytidylate kinase